MRGLSYASRLEITKTENKIEVKLMKMNMKILSAKNICETFRKRRNYDEQGTILVQT